MAINFPNSPTDGELYTSNNSTWVYSNTKTCWKSVRTSVSTARQAFTATANQTTFTINGGYIPSNVDVYYNGAKLLNGVEVNVSSGSEIILSTGAIAGALIDVVGIKPYTAIGETSVSVRQQYTATANQTTFVVSGGYIAGQLDVYYNGIKLINGSQVNVSSGYDIVLSTPAVLGAVIELVGMQSQAQTIAGSTPSPVRQIFTATANQTNFTVTGGYTAGQIDVYYNGSKLVNGSDVNVSNGLDVVLSTPASVGAVIEVVGMSTISYLDAFKTSGGTITGTLTAQNFSGNGALLTGLTLSSLYTTGTPSANTYLSGDSSWKQLSLNTLSISGTANSNTFLTGSSTWRTISSADLGTGTANSNTFLNGSSTWRTISSADLGTGTANSETYLAGDNSWKTVNNFAKLNSSQTFSAKQIFSTDTSIGAKISNLAETANVVISVAPATVNYDILTQSVLYYTANSTSNVTVNLRGSSTKTLDSIVANGECITAVFVMTNGLTAYTANTIQIDGIAVTPKWQGGTRAIGNANSADSYIFSTVKTSNNSYIVLASLTKYS